MKTSSGILPYRVKNGRVQVFLVHAGGPFWEHRDEWGLCKGEVEGDSELYSAIREFKEETGVDFTELENRVYVKIGWTQQNKNKKTHCFATIYHDDIKVKSNEIEIEWPTHSGEKITIPEIDKGEFFDIEVAKQKIYKSQLIFLTRLEDYYAHPESYNIED